jgi:hypothetical protein
MPGDPGGLVVTTLVCLFHFTHEAAGAAGTRHSPRPLLGGSLMHNSGALRGENAKACLMNADAPTLGRRRQRAIQYSEASMIERRSCGVLDTPLEPVIGLAEGETRWRSMTSVQDDPSRLTSSHDFRALLNANGDTRRMLCEQHLPATRSISARQSPAPWSPAACCGCAGCGRCRR